MCVHPDLVDNLLFEIHEGICGSHTGGRSLAHRAMSQGYWWPYMQSDAVGMSGNVINAKDLLRKFTNLLGNLIHYQARGLLLSGAWILWALFLGHREIRSF